MADQDHQFVTPFSIHHGRHSRPNDGVASARLCPAFLCLQRKDGSKRAARGATIAELISSVGEFMTLAPGDLTITGTLAGVGMGMAPPDFMKAGDLMEIVIRSEGMLRSKTL
ncbi:fumarylacetoacetate hydrolase family protein [Bradyrhizobium sp.]|uniref:fumarylacetoacetate hydrolase family protein n=1 Tax=Bradyrhizobium sp. TaxID=376 RepID=UPI003C71C7B3